MHDFGYCIWLVKNKEDYIWNFPNKGFETHITIKKNLIYEDCLKYYNLLRRYTVVVEKSDRVVQTHENNFYALQFSVIYSNLNVKDKPEWWPNDAHVTIKYKYDEKFMESDIKQSVITKRCLFDKLIMVKCIGHYNDWEIIKS